MRLSRPHRYPSSRFSLGPGRAVVQGLGGRQWDSLTKVNHPYSGQAWSIVNEQQRTPNHLMRNGRVLKCAHLQGKVLSLWNITYCVPEMKIFWPGQEKDFTTWKEHSSPRVSWRTLTSPERCVAPPASADTPLKKKHTVQDKCNYPLPVSGFWLVNTALQYC